MNGKVEDAYSALEEAVETIVGEPGRTWREKRDDFAAWIQDNGGSALQEFISWFTGEMEE